MPSIDALIAALQAQRAIHGGDAEVTAVVEHGQAGLVISDRHIVRDTALAGTAAASGASGGVEHGLYLAARSLADVRAVQRGRLGHRLVRRAAMKRIGRTFGRW